MKGYVAMPHSLIDSQWNLVAIHVNSSMTPFIMYQAQIWMVHDGQGICMDYTSTKEPESMQASNMSSFFSFLSVLNSVATPHMIMKNCLYDYNKCTTWVQQRSISYITL